MEKTIKTMVRRQVEEKDALIEYEQEAEIRSASTGRGRGLGLVRRLRHGAVGAQHNGVGAQGGSLAGAAAGLAGTVGRGGVDHGRRAVGVGVIEGQARASG
jgi:hypothetical protein